MQIDEYVQRLLAHSGITEVEVSASEDTELNKILIQIDVPEDDSGVLIGHHGETLASIQRIVNIVFRDELEDKRVTVNINDYRERRTEALKAKTERIAYRVVETGQPFTFNYLPANERFIVHSTLSENEEFAELESVSSGEGRDRLLTIQVKA